MRSYNEIEILEALKRIEGKIDGLKKIEKVDEFLTTKRKKRITPDTLLTINEVSEVLNITPRTIRKWIKEYIIAFVALPGGNLRIKKANLDNWIQYKSVKEIYR